MKILIFSKYGVKGASSRYRVYQYLPFFKEADISFTINNLFDDSYLDQLYNNNSRLLFPIIKAFIKRIGVLLKVKQYDLLLIEYELFPYFPSLFEFFLKIFNKKYIVDYDDAIFHNYDLNSNKLIRSLLKNKIGRVMKYSSAVIVGSHYLYDYSKRWNSNVYLLPTVVNLELYTNTVPVKNEKDFIIGWIGSPSTSKYMIPLIDVFRKLSTTGVKFSFIGFDKSLREKFEGLKVNWIDWSDETEIQSIKSFSIGIMPLDDNPWTRGKCGFKLIQYMASEIPVLASSVGENKYIVNHGKNGYLIESLESWYEQIHMLSRENGLLKELGKNGLSLVKEKYSLKVTSEQFVSIITSYS